MLTGREIMRQRALGNIIIEPFNFKFVNPNSYNVTLNKELKVYDCDILDAKKDNPTKTIIIPESGYVLQPNILYLGRTNEYTKTVGFVPCVDGRSSVGRLGLGIHITAGFGDNGFGGTFTLEMLTIHPLRVYPNMQIGQIYFYELQGAQTYYNGRYQGQIEATASRYYKTENGRPHEDYSPTFEM